MISILILRRYFPSLYLFQAKGLENSFRERACFARSPVSLRKSGRWLTGAGTGERDSLLADGALLVSVEIANGVSTGFFFPSHSISATNCTVITVRNNIERRIFMAI